MLFVTFQFAFFFLALLLLLRLSSRRRALGNPILLAASLLFYALWIPAYLPLLLATVGINYALLRGMTACEPRSPRRRAYLTGSIVFTISLLLYFKYAAFLVESAFPFLAQLAGAVPIPDVLLPLGISFYSFQIVSLAVDTYREDGPVIEGLSHYALYIAFFPQLIAGPILRGRELLPQLSAGAQPNSKRFRRGAWLLALGVTKKLVLADFLLAPFADSVFEMPGVANARFHWVALYAFAFQIYFDFSGYTDIARGLALWIGFELPENFHEPYLSRNPSEFWRRWHITLSRWLRDYLYIPLGGNRAGGSRSLLNLMLTMLLGGLWHGAAWNFIVWGGLHGLLLIAHRPWRTPGPSERAPGWRDAPHIFLNFHFVCLAWVFFRTPDLAAAGNFLSALWLPGELSGWPLLALGSVALSAALHVIERLLRLRSEQVQAWFAARPARAYLEASLFGVVLGTAILVSGAGSEFLYFQF
jgi:D-alanyl-lipoteichoic acid acyltransferase DltB (MBOAT superfamily)